MMSHVPRCFVHGYGAPYSSASYKLDENHPNHSVVFHFQLLLHLFLSRLSFYLYHCSFASCKPDESHRDDLAALQFDPANRNCHKNFPCWFVDYYRYLNWYLSRLFLYFYCHFVVPHWIVNCKQVESHWKYLAAFSLDLASRECHKNCQLLLQRIVDVSCSYHLTNHCRKCYLFSKLALLVVLSSFLFFSAHFVFLLLLC